MDNWKIGIQNLKMYNLQIDNQNLQIDNDNQQKTLISVSCTKGEGEGKRKIKSVGRRGSRDFLVPGRYRYR